MTYPLIYQGYGTLKIPNDTEFSNIAQTVLEYMASNAGTSDLTVQLGTTSYLDYTNVGTIVIDRYQENIGSHVSTTYSETYRVFQDLTTPEGDDPPSPIIYLNSDSPLKVTSDEELNDLANSIITWGVVNEGPNSYQIANSAPTDGGTWTAVSTIEEDYTVTEYRLETYYLWKKLSSGVFTTETPLKIDTDGSSLKLFSQAEIESLSKKVRERIVNGGIGQYVASESAPASGTWVSKGSIIDRRATIYTFSYAKEFIGESPYQGIGPINYDTSYQHVFTIPAAYTKYYDGPEYDSPESFVGPNTVNYSGEAQFENPLAGFFTGYSVDGGALYLGPGPFPYESTNVLYTGFLPGSENTQYYTFSYGSFTATIPYLGQFKYTGTNIYNVVDDFYDGRPGNEYINENRINYTQNLYTNSLGTEYAGLSTNGVIYTGPAVYTQTGGYLGPGLEENVYIRENDFYYSGPQRYLGAQTAFYTSIPEFIGTNVNASQYSADFSPIYTGPVFYLDEDFAYLGAGTFVGFNRFIGNYQNLFIGLAQYTNEYDAIYEGTISTDYTGTAQSGVTVNYIGTTVLDIEQTSSPVTLWRRVA